MATSDDQERGDEQDLSHPHIPTTPSQSTPDADRLPVFDILEPRLRKPFEGCEAMRAVIAETKARTVWLDSPAEVSCWRQLLRANIEMPTPHHKVRTADGRVVTLDFAWVKQKVGLEVLGWSAHGDPRAFDKDARRQSQLQLVDWLVLPATARQISEGFQRILLNVRLALSLKESASREISPRP